MLLSSLNKVTIWGFGREGQAVKRFIETKYPACQIKIQTDPLSEPLSGLVIKSPGISIYRVDVLEAMQKGVVFTSATNLFLEQVRCSSKRPFLIGVTGTKGKSTTSSLIAHCLKHAGKNVALGGNIGTPLIDFSDSLENLDFVVAEISSYQASDLAYSFDVSVVLNLYPEHIDWHKTHAQYYTDKLNIFKHKTSTQRILLNKQDPNTKQFSCFVQDGVYFNDPASIHIKNGFFYSGKKQLFSTDCVPLKGEHNLINVCACLTVLELAGIDITLCADALRTFQALPHRLQPIDHQETITFVDDSISTTPETAIAALKAFSPAPIILIAGGYDRAQDYTELALFIAQGGAKAVVTLPPTGDRLADLVLTAGGVAYKAKTMDEAVLKAKEIAQKNSIILLSPAAPSYGIYQNFEERGAVFKKCVLGLNKPLCTESI